MRDPEGGFYSSEDADSEGEEGRFYAFTPAEVGEVLGEADARRFCEAYGISVQGNFEGGRSVLHRFSAPKYPAGDNRLEAELEPLRRRLWQARERRVHPHKDDKVLAAWNGLALSAMAIGHQVLGDPRYLEAGTACAEFLQRELSRDGGLLRTWRRGRAHIPAFLEDYASVTIGLVDLYETSFDPRWLRWAETLTAGMRERFEDAGGGFFSTGRSQEDVILRQKPAFDHSLPSANALAIQALLRVGHHLERRELLDSAERALACFARVMTDSPHATLGMLESLELSIRGPLEIVISGPKNDPRTRRLLERAWRLSRQGRMLALVHDESGLSRHPGKVPVGGMPAAYVCMDRACQDPVTSPEALETLLHRQF